MTGVADSPLVEQARQLLAAATDGPWVWDDETGDLYGAGVSEVLMAYYSGRGTARIGVDECDAALIAAAPSLLLGLLGELSEVVRQRDEARQLATKYQRRWRATQRHGAGITDAALPWEVE